MSSALGGRRAAGAALLGLALGALGPKLAHARGEAVAVTLAACLPPELQADVIAALQVELRETTTSVARASGAPQPGAARLELGPGCDPSRLELRVRLAGGLTPPDAPPDAQRTIDIQQVPDAARPRVVAIALAELLRSAIDDPEQAARSVRAAADGAHPPPADVAPATPAAAAPGPPRRQLPIPRVRLHAGAQARATTDPAAAHLGPRLDARFPALPWLDVAVGAAALFAGAETRLGDVDASAFLARAALLVASRRRTHQIDVGAFVEAGAARIAGTPARAGVVAREAASAVAGLGIVAGGELSPIGPLSLRAEVEVGAGVAPLQGDADDRPTPGYGGPFVGASAQVGVAF